jgi:hypothetical protein
MSISLRTSSLRLSFAALALCGVAACNQADSATTTDLERDLEQTKMAEMEMANRSGARTDIVSSVERIPTGERQPVVKAPANPIPEKPAPEVAPLPDINGIPSDRPRPPELSKPARKGPYKSTSEVIRNAPFPINP